MFTNFLQECVFIACVFSDGFIKSTLSSAILPNNKLVRGVQSASLPNKGFYKTPPLKNSFPKWSMSILKDRVSMTSLKEVEPGFDFTDAEMTKFKLWPRGVIPYYIDDFSYDKVLRDRIRGFLAATNEVTGLNFVELATPPVDSDSRWVFFINRVGKLDCLDHSVLNMTNESSQRVVLGYDCMSTGGELAEAVLAIAGVPAQHNAPDRDEYITVQMDHIIPGKKYLFDKLKDDEWLFHDLDYDFASAGHYHYHRYTNDGLSTIQPKTPVDFSVGEGDGFSSSDILKIRMLYNYISKKKDTDAAVPECEKLFKPGSQFSMYKPEDPTDEIQPRAKPNKYTGQADDTPSANTEQEPTPDEDKTKPDKEIEDEEKTYKSSEDKTKPDKEVEDDEKTNKSGDVIKKEEESTEKKKAEDTKSDEEKNNTEGTLLDIRNGLRVFRTGKSVNKYDKKKKKRYGKS